MTAHERLTKFERFCARIPERQTSLQVIAELESRARAINGGKNLPRPYPPQNGGSW